MRVLGIDPGFAFVGWCVADVTLKGQVTLISAGTWETKKCKKKELSASEDNMRRADELSLSLAHLDTQYGPFKAILSEAQSWPRNASSALKIALWWGIISHFRVTYPSKLILLQCSPQELKKCMKVKEKSSKQEVLESILVRPGYGNIMDLLSHIRSKAKRCHPIDAAAAICTCLEKYKDILNLEI